MNEELKTPEDHLFKTFHRSDDWDFRVIIPDVTEGQRFRPVPVKSVVTFMWKSSQPTCHEP